MFAQIKIGLDKLQALLPAGFLGLVYDKRLHFAAGLSIGMLAQGVAWMVAKHPLPFMGVVLATAVGLAKELSDRWANYKAKKRGDPPPHGVEFLDFAYTALAGLVADLLNMALAAMLGA